MITLPDFIAIALAAFALYQIRQLRVEYNARLTTLERREPEKWVRVQEKPQPKQIFEKPVVPGAKETTSLQIGGGKLHADQENHVYEWV